MRKNRRRLVKRKRIVIVVQLLLMVLVGISIFNIVAELFPVSDTRPGTQIDSKTIVKDGVAYYPRQDITVFMLIGIDKKGPKVDSGSYNNDGQADLISLIVFNKTHKSYKILLLNRDTMTDIPILGVGGRPAGTINAQLALAHNQGSGLHDSCENMKNALSKLLGNIPIDYYISMNLDAISILNDAVGGVEVDVKDDFSLIDPTIKKGKMLLNGEQALSFVQTRKDVGDQLNLSRMERHKQYMNGFFEAFIQKFSGSKTEALRTYDDISDYIVVDDKLEDPTMIYSLFNHYSAYKLKEVVSPKGTNEKGEKYMEYYVNEDNLLDLTLRLFYSEKR